MYAGGSTSKGARCLSAHYHFTQRALIAAENGRDLELQRGMQMAVKVVRSSSKKINMEAAHFAAEAVLAGKSLELVSLSREPRARARAQLRLSASKDTQIRRSPLTQN